MRKGQGQRSRIGQPSLALAWVSAKNLSRGTKFRKSWEFVVRLSVILGEMFLFFLTLKNRTFEKFAESPCGPLGCLLQ